MNMGKWMPKEQDICVTCLEMFVQNMGIKMMRRYADRMALDISKADILVCCDNMSAGIVGANVRASTAAIRVLIAQRQADAMQYTNQRIIPVHSHREWMECVDAASKGDVRKMQKEVDTRFRRHMKIMQGQDIPTSVRSIEPARMAWIQEKRSAYATQGLAEIERNKQNMSHMAHYAYRP